MNANKIYKKLDQIKTLPTLPTVAMEVNRLLEDYDTGIEALIEVIQKDQCIAPKMLRLVNSAFFGFKSKIVSLPHAITLLGYNTVRNAVVTIAIIDAFKHIKDIPNFKIADFWSHALAIATLSNHMAKTTKLLPPDDAFTAGLIHDIGKLILVEFFPEMFTAAWQYHQQERIPFYAAEKKELPVTHATVGAHLAAKWRLPQKLVEVVRYHHNGRNRSTENRSLMVVYLADSIYRSMNNQCSFKLNGYELNETVKTPIMNYLKALPEWYPKIKKDIESAYSFFQKV